jgi:hypothetical protein
LQGTQQLVKLEQNISPLSIESMGILIGGIPQWEKSQLDISLLILADILACLLDLNFKQNKLTRFNFSKLTLLKHAYFA